MRIVEVAQDALENAFNRAERAVRRLRDREGTFFNRRFRRSALERNQRELERREVERKHQVMPGDQSLKG